MLRFLLHSNPFRLGRKANTSADRSTGCSRRTGGHFLQVDGCVVVPIMDHAAVVACPLPIRECQAGVDTSAIAASLAGRIPLVRHDDTSALHRGLVFDLPTKLEHADIGDGTREFAVCHHAAHVQVFDADHIELVHDLRGGLVQRVLPDVGDPRVQPGQPRRRLAPVGRAFDLAAMGTAASAQRLEVPAQRLGAFDGSPVAQCRESLHTEINATCHLGFANRYRVINFDAQADEPAIRRARHDGGFDLAVEADGFAHFHPTDDREFDTLAVYVNRIWMQFIRAGVSPKTVVGHSLFLEAGIFGAAFKEVLEGCAEVLDSLLRCVLRHLQHPREGVRFQRI